MSDALVSVCDEIFEGGGIPVLCSVDVESGCPLINFMVEHGSDRLEFVESDYPYVLVRGGVVEVWSWDFKVDVYPGDPDFAEQLLVVARAARHVVAVQNSGPKSWLLKELGEGELG